MSAERDETDRLAEALRRTPAPDPRVRDAALSAAMAAFDRAKTDAAAQAAVDRLRPKERPRLAARLFGGLKMPTLSLRPAFYGGASLAVLALALVLVQDPGLLDPRPAPVTETVAEPETRPTPAPREAEAGPAPRPPLPETAEDLAAGTPAPPAEADSSAPPSRMRQTQALELAPEPLPDDGPPRVIIRRGTMAAEERVATPPPAANAPAPKAEATPPPAPSEARDRFETTPRNPVSVTAETPVSTFSIDVDTASYAWMRRSLREGRMPDPASVRIEELINYFPYALPAPESPETPFATTVNVMPTPWNPDTRLLHIGIQGYDLAPEARPDANLVFLIDVSGSMNAPDKLPLLLNALRMLLGELRPTDEVAIVTYAGEAGVALEPTAVAEREKILAALARLEAGGGTRGDAGLREAYALARQMMAEGETTRVLLATDGDFNLGLSDDDALTRLIETERESGVFLSVLGFGEGNYNDTLMQRLAQNGNGVAAYVDTLSEARKLLVEGLTGNLVPIAKDVKIQVEFNPATVAEYRLIGYETRALAREDFNDDTVDAGEIGAGHSVTALYEITPVGSPARLTDPLRYADAPDPATGEYAFLKLRYKLPGGAESVLVTRPVTPADARAPDEARFAAAVAGFGQLLTGGRYLGDWSYADALALARETMGEDPLGHRAGFLELIRTAETLSTLPR